MSDFLPFGARVRKELFPSEKEYFRRNPHVAGMAAEDNRVILNPFSPLSEDQRRAVAHNEAARLFMRGNNISPDFQVTESQRSLFSGSPYENNEKALKETIAARLFSDDSSAGEATQEQRDFVNHLVTMGNLLLNQQMPIEPYQPTGK